ncbi:MAG: phosphate ABC transporter substrate-binding protein PstS [Bacteroidales bacterium]|jgi:phosphate transport system substrate-binding protein|nr:phosphate ABC transporter substrate-binding protein PstS [Bacteroidales bacterium]
MKTIVRNLLIAAAALSAASCGNGSKADRSLAGAGGTFPVPYYNLAFQTYQKANKIEITYGAIGSGGGIRSLKDKVVDFGASDAFLSDAEMAGMPAPVIHIPTCMGAVVVAYNLKDVKNLKLTGDIIADIYLGKITRWNDARIAEINTGTTLPDKKITPVYRSDGSGTTFIFSDYMSKVSPAWKDAIGRGKSLKWSKGIASKGNPGVAGTVSQTEGAIGYIGSEYAFAQDISYAGIKNAAGEFITPNLTSISKAASGDMPADTRCMITDSQVEGAYPISCFTWILIYKEQFYNKRTAKQAQNTVALIRWMLGPEAQALTEKVNYAPLPQEVIENAKKQLSLVTYKDAQIETPENQNK